MMYSLIVVWTAAQMICVSLYKSNGYKQPLQDKTGILPQESIRHISPLGVLILRQDCDIGKLNLPMTFSHRASSILTT